MTTNILETIAADTRKRVLQAKAENPLERLQEQCRSLNQNRTSDFPFEAALAAPGLSVIAEVKRASPSKGLIVEDFDYLEIAREYLLAGATAISVLTEPNFFMGASEYLAKISQSVDLPLLRKDFIVDAYQIYQSKLLGASAILLICSLLTDAQLNEYLSVADALGLSALVEARDARELNRAVAAGARIVGVNNRNLETFAVDVTSSQRLRQSVPDNILFVSESGIRTPEDAIKLAAFGVDAVLIGEALMKSVDKVGFIGQINSQVGQGGLGGTSTPSPRG